MKRKFNPAVLFRRHRYDPKLAPYPSWKAQLAAIASGKKGIERTGFPVVYMSYEDREFQGLLRDAFEHNLLLVIHDGPTSTFPLERKEPDIYLVRPDQLWRIPALITLRDAAFVDGRWNDQAEMFESALLGYKKAQRKRWLEHVRQWQAGWGLHTIYTLLSSEQKQRVVSLGHRCFGTSADVANMTFYSYDSSVVKRDAYRRVPRGLTLARVAITWRASSELFGRPGTKKNWHRQQLTLTTAQAAILNDGMRSAVHLLGPRGWSRSD